MRKKMGGLVVVVLAETRARVVAQTRVWVVVIAETRAGMFGAARTSPQAVTLAKARAGV